jgi:hypothetical protein
MCNRVVATVREYTLPEHLERLRGRGLFGKRSLARREFALEFHALAEGERGLTSRPV